MRYYIVRVRKLGSLKIGDLENIELGKPFALYNVDGRQQPAYVYLPLYKEGKAIYIINALEYREGKWMYGGGPIAFVIEENQTEILNQMKYGKEECIFYSINNTCYVESETKRLVISKANARDEEMYSEKEEVFLNMNFQEKKGMVENGLKELCDTVGYNEFDEDVEKQLTGDIENQEKMEVSAKINKEAKALLIFIIGIICFEIVVKRQKRRYVIISVLILFFTVISKRDIQADWEKMFKSEYYPEINVENAIEFANSTYKEYLKYNMMEYQYSFKIEQEEVEQTELGKHFVIYNVDGSQQPAYVYFPVYKDGKCVDIINAVEYQSGYWQYGFGPIAFYIRINQTSILDEMDYRNQDCIVYSINNRCYIESESIVRILDECKEKDADIYSELEEQFLAMSFSEKKKTIEQGTQKLCDISKYNEFDNDVNKQLVGNYEETVNMEVKEKEGQEQSRAAFYCFISGAVGIVLGSLFLFVWKKRNGEV